MGLFDQVAKILGANNSTIASVTNRGSKGAVATELLDSAGNQITGFGGSSLVNAAYDYITITSYDNNNNPLIVVFKSGGANGTVVATLTLTYSGTNLLTVTKT